jgi:Zn-dependent peptidase ImmA (M78 family)
MSRKNRQHTEPRNDEACEEAVFRALVDAGGVIPCTEAEVAAEELRQKTAAMQRESGPPSADAVLEWRHRIKSGAPHKMVEFPRNTAMQVSSDLARAARKGHHFSAEIEAKLEQSRQNVSRQPAGNVKKTWRQCLAAEPPGHGVLTLERQRELSELAEFVVETYCTGGRVSPEVIIAAKGINLDYGNYSDAFDGMLEHKDGSFFIHCNLDLDNLPDSPRARFTLAHELAHFFIDEHRNALVSGRVGPHPSFSDHGLGDLFVEREADFFASRLLLPELRFKKLMRTKRVCLDTILFIAGEFDVSVTCTAIRAVTSGMEPSALVKWSKDSVAWKWCSSEFWELGYRKTVEESDQIPPDSASGKCFAIMHNANSGIFKGASVASAWFPAIHQRSEQNVILQEEAMILGKYGVLTLLTLNERPNWFASHRCVD